MRILTSTVLIACCLIGKTASSLVAQEAPSRLGELADWRFASATQDPNGDVILADTVAPPANPATGAAGDDAWVSEDTQATPTQGETGFAGPKPWEVRFIAYGWIPGFDGHAGQGANPPKLDISYCDVLDNIDLIDCMVPVDLEVRYGPVGVFADLFYVKLSDQVRRDLVSVNLVGKQTILEVGGFYRLDTCPLNSQGSSLTVDVLGGARYNRLAGAIGLEAPQQAISISRAREWWDPFVGPRVIWQVTDQFSLRARGDVGGFGIENCSHIVWQINAAAEYDICRNVLIQVGYRLLNTNFETDSGADHFTYNVLMQGPYVALGVKF
jgi:hypothetical protein